MLSVWSKCQSSSTKSRRDLGSLHSFVVLTHHPIILKQVGCGGNWIDPTLTSHPPLLEPFESPDTQSNVNVIDDIYYLFIITVRHLVSHAAQCSHSLFSLLSDPHACHNMHLLTAPYSHRPRYTYVGRASHSLISPLTCQSRHTHANIVVRISSAPHTRRPRYTCVDIAACMSVAPHTLRHRHTPDHRSLTDIDTDLSVSPHMCFHCRAHAGHTTHLLGQPAGHAACGLADASTDCRTHLTITVTHLWLRSHTH